MKRNLIMLVAVAVTAALATTAAAMQLSAWGPAANAKTIPGTSAILNTFSLEGCAFIAPRDDILYFASNRAGGMGGLDIWYSLRNEAGGWGDPVNLTAVNSTADDLCPTAQRNGKDLLFVSNREGGCGGTDIYATRMHRKHGWSIPRNLGCGVNSSGDEAGPYLLEDDLYFSSTRAGGFAEEPPGTAPDGDIYVSAFDDGSYGAPALVPGLNTAANDLRPNLRRDGREIFFDSNRTGGQGMLDLWTSTRTSKADPWSTPANLGPNVNSSANDLRASLSWDAKTLYFGSTRPGGEGSQDIYVTTREKIGRSGEDD